MKTHFDNKMDPEKELFLSKCETCEKCMNDENLGVTCLVEEILARQKIKHAKNR